MSGFWIQAVGYAGSTLVILSLLQKSILRLRTIGVVASTTFFFYSVTIGAYPIAVVNVTAVTIHLYHLRRLVRLKNEVFRILTISPDSRYLEYFLEFHDKDIAAGHNAGFSYDPGEKTLAVLLLRDLVPAGLLIANMHGDSSIEVLLDYVIPQYRDFKLAQWLYSEASGLFTEASCRCAWTRVATPKQETYYTRVGFRPDRTPAVPERYSFILQD